MRMSFRSKSFHTLLIAGVTASYECQIQRLPNDCFHTLLIAGVTARSRMARSYDQRRRFPDPSNRGCHCKGGSEDGSKKSINKSFHTLLIAGVTARVHLLRIKSFLSASARSDFVRHCGCLPPHQGYKKTPANRPLGIENGGHDGRLWIENCGCLHRRRGFITTPANRLHGFENGGQSSYRLTENCGCLQRCG